jgi:hypothetical protein
MKRFFYAAFMAVVCAVMCASCEKEQSSMTIEDIPGRAVIRGKLTYDAGQAYVNGTYVQQILPASSKTVVVRVKNSTLSPTKKADGYTTYQVTTGSDGAFSIEIPATDSGVEVEVSPESFIGNYSEFDEMNGASPQFNTVEKEFSINAETRTLKAYDTFTFNKHYTSKSMSSVDTFEYTSYLEVKVGEPTCEPDYEDDTVDYKYSPANGKNVVISVKYSHGGSSVTKHYGATTNNGVASFAIPAYEKDWSASISISVEAYKGNMRHYYMYDYDTISLETLSGIYSGSTNVNCTFNPLEPTVAKVKLSFTPSSDYGVHHYNQYKWSSADIEF